MTRHSLIEGLVVFLITFAAVGFVWSFTGAPMMRNYAECGSVFLCSARR